MSFKDYLEEEYYNTYKLNGQIVEVFLNPTSGEPKNNPKIVRAILDKKGDLFAWDGETETIHEPVMNRMNKNKENGAISIILFPRTKLVEISLWDWKQADLTQQEVERIKNIVKNNSNVKKYMKNDFRIKVDSNLFD
jgi:hypothetical protein